MAQHNLNQMRVAILVTDGFEQVEMTEPRQALDRAGAKTVLVSPKSGEVQGFHHHDKGDRFPVDMSLDDANPDEFDGVVLPGGGLNADSLRVNPKAQAFVKRIDETNRPIAVICHGAWLLVSAELTPGRTLTSYHTIVDDIRNSGGNWEDREVVRDRNWVSSRNPHDLPAFNRETLELFAQQHSQTQPQAVG
jgi:protease I